MNMTHFKLFGAPGYIDVKVSKAGPPRRPWTGSCAESSGASRGAQPPRRGSSPPGGSTQQSPRFPFQGSFNGDMDMGAGVDIDLEIDVDRYGIWLCL